MTSLVILIKANMTVGHIRNFDPGTCNIYIVHIYIYYTYIHIPCAYDGHNVIHVRRVPNGDFGRQL